MQKFEQEMRVRGKRAYYKHVAGEVLGFVALVVVTAVFAVLYMAVFAD